MLGIVAADAERQCGSCGSERALLRGPTTHPLGEWQLDSVLWQESLQ
jgi:hypothetical protein